MNIALAIEVLALKERVAALERMAASSSRRVDALSAQAAAMRVQGDALRAEVRTILDAHRGPRRLKAFAVLTMLKRDPPPSLRRVQEVIREIRVQNAKNIRTILDLPYHGVSRE